MTIWRKWFVRGLALAIVISVGMGVYLFERYTNAEEVRSQVLTKLGALWPGAIVNVESARLRLLGGISVSELRLLRRDDSEGAEFLHVPTAILYHDKENLLDGKFRILKLELQRPRIHLVHNADGTWNTSGILGESNPDVPVPTLLIKDGTLILEDHRLGNGAPPLEIKDVNLTMVNDPVSTLTINGSGACEVLGTVQLAGTIYRATNEATFNIEAPNIPVGPALIQRLYPFAPDMVVHARFLEGTGQLQAEIHSQPGSPQPMHHDICFHLTNGKFHHALLPLPLDHLDASVRIIDGHVTLDQCTARSGDTCLDVKFKELLLDGERRWEERFRELDVKIQRLPLSRDILERAKLNKIWDDYSPAGDVNATLTIRRDSAAGWHKHCIVEPLGAHAMSRYFKYPLDNIRGTLEHDAGSGTPEQFKLDLSGAGKTRPVHIRGTIKGAAPDHEVDVKIWGDNIALDKTLENALPERFQTLARAFKPTGRGDFVTTLSRDPTTRVSTQHHLIHFHDCTMSYAKFPYPLEDVSLTLNLLPDHWMASDFRGTHKGAVITGRVDSYPSAESERVVATINGKNLECDQELEGALLNPDLHSAYAAFEPRGKCDVTCTVSYDVHKPGSEAHSTEHGKETEPDVNLTLWPKGGSIRPKFFPCLLEELTGKIHYADHWVTVEDLQAHNGPSAWKLPHAEAFLKPGGGYYAAFRDLEANPLIPDQQFIDALPAALRKGWNALNLRDPVGIRTLLIIDSKPTNPRPDIYWDGVCALRDAQLRTGIQLDHVSGKIACRGRHNGDQLLGVAGNLHLDQATLFNQPVQDVTSPFTVSQDAPDVLRFHDLWMRYCGGAVYGPIKVEFGSTVRYELNLIASEVKLEQVGRQNLGKRAQISGVASANLYLTGQGSDINALKGNGKIRVPEGKMYNLPLALDLLKVLGLRLPDRTAFEEAEADFEVQGKRLQFKELNLLGNAISLRGKGEMNMDGSGLDLDFNADWGRMHQVLPTPLKPVEAYFSDQLLKIRMTGAIGDVHCLKEILPPVSEPLKKVLQGDMAIPNH